MEAIAQYRPGNKHESGHLLNKALVLRLRDNERAASGKHRTGTTWYLWIQVWVLLPLTNKI